MLQSPRWLSLLAVLVALSVCNAAAQSADPLSASDLRAQLRQLAPLHRDEVVWLARCMYSESDRAHEQRLVAWVVRNRVETGFRGKTYREVILEPRQFSAFNEPTRRRAHLLSLNEHSLSSSWRQALQIALEVYRAPAQHRPFPLTTRHFYSPVSMRNHSRPDWADNATPLSAARLGIDPYRFQFFDGIDEGVDPPVQTASETTTATQDGTYVRPRLRGQRRSSLSSRRFSGRIKRPVRPHRDSRARK